MRKKQQESIPQQKGRPRFRPEAVINALVAGYRWMLPIRIIPKKPFPTNAAFLHRFCVGNEDDPSYS
jgi:hypothetical protein